MKRITIMLLLIINMLLLSACGATQVNERIFVQMMGIEENNGICELTVQVYNVEASGGSKDQSKPEYKIISGSGRSFYEAVGAISEESGKKPFFGHCTAVYANEAVIRNKDTLRMLAGERISIGCPVIYSEKPSRSVNVKDENGDLTGADIITARLDYLHKSGLSAETTLKNVTAAATNSRPIIIPMAEDEPVGTAIILSDGRTIQLDMSETAVYNLLREEAGISLSVLGGSLSVDNAEKNVYYQTLDNKNGEYNITIKVECTLKELGSSDITDEYAAEAEKIISLSAEQICRKALNDGFLETITETGKPDTENISFRIYTNADIK